LKSLDGDFAKSASSPPQIIEHKGLIEMTEPRAQSTAIPKIELASDRSAKT
jgi:hypothetical protein